MIKLYELSAETRVKLQQFDESEVNYVLELASNFREAFEMRPCLGAVKPQMGENGAVEIVLKTLTFLVKGEPHD